MEGNWVQFTQKRLSNWNHHIPASRDSRKVYESSNWRFCCPLYIDDCLRSLFDIESRVIQIKTYYVQGRQKRQYNLNTLPIALVVSFLNEMFSFKIWLFKDILLSLGKLHFFRIFKTTCLNSASKVQTPSFEICKWTSRPSI